MANKEVKKSTEENVEEEPSKSTKSPLIGVIDSGTTTIKFAIFKSRQNKEFIKSSKEIESITPEEGWYEQDPMQIISIVKSCIKDGISQLKSKGIHKCF